MRFEVNLSFFQSDAIRSNRFGRVFGPNVAPLIQRGMTGPQKVWLMVVLQAVAEQDPKFVMSDAHRQYRQKRRERAAREAKTYLGSPDFEYVCELAGIDPSFARSLTPEKANDALNTLAGTLGQDIPNEPDYEDEEFAA